MLTVIVGTEFNGKMNYNTIADVGIIDHDLLSISMRKIDYAKVDPIFFSMQRFKYWKLGGELANCHSIGK